MVGCQLRGSLCKALDQNLDVWWRYIDNHSALEYTIDGCACELFSSGVLESF